MQSLKHVRQTEAVLAHRRLWSLAAGEEPDRTQLSAPQCPTLAPSGAMIDNIDFFSILSGILKNLKIDKT